MQLDFFKAIFDRSPAAKPDQPANPTPLKEVASLLEDPWLRRAREILHTAGVQELAKKVQLRWNPKMRSTAGTALPGRTLVTLNPRLREFGDAEVDRTLRHELAHLLAHHRAGKRRIAPHGPEWKRACRDLGLSDESRCHTLPLPRRKIRQPHRYCCPHCGLELRRTRPIRRKLACLACCRQWNRGRYDDRFRFVKVRALSEA